MGSNRSSLTRFVTHGRIEDQIKDQIVAKQK